MPNAASNVISMAERRSTGGKRTPRLRIEITDNFTFRVIDGQVLNKSEAKELMQSAAALTTWLAGQM
jgi:hypothetical protein